MGQILKNYNRRGLVGHWKYHGNVSALGTWYDISGNGNHGTLVGNAFVDINGVNVAANSHRVNLGKPSSLSVGGLSEASISCWFYPNSNPGSNAAIYYESTTSSGYSRLGIFHQSSGEIEAVVRDSNSGGSFLARSPVISNNLWYYIAFSHNSVTNIMSLYINNILVAENTASKGSFTTGLPAENITIAAFPLTSTAIRGKIDDVRIYNRALSAAEIAQIYHQTRRF